MNLLAAAEGLSHVQNLPNSKSKLEALKPKPETPALALTPHTHTPECSVTDKPLRTSSISNLQPVIFEKQADSEQGGK